MTVSEPGVVAEGVWKRFRRGEVHDSIRDLIPAIVRRSFSRRTDRELENKREFWALHDVSFTVSAGEALGIIGPNGAGKSTILRLLSRILKPNRGRIAVTGRVGAIIEVTAGFHPDLTGRENVMLGGAIMGMQHREVRSNLDGIIEFAGISPFIDTPVKRYSSGMLARLGFSIAAHLDPDVLLVDEVLAVGDLAFQRQCYEFMSQLTTRGVAVVFVSHNMAAIAQLCPQTLLLSRGKVKLIGTTQEAQQAYLDLVGGSQSANGYVLESIELTDKDGKPRRSFPSGSSCCVRGRVRVGEECTGLSLGIAIVQGTGFEVFHSTVVRLGGGPVNVNSGEVVELAGELVLNLVGGSYMLQIHGLVYNRPERERFRFDATRFDVDDAPGIGGVANLQPTLRQQVQE